MIMMPLHYIDSYREKASIEVRDFSKCLINLQSEMRMILKDYHEDQGNSDISDPTDRMKPLDLVKIMMGVYSDRAVIKRHMNDARVWAKF